MIHRNYIFCVLKIFTDFPLNTFEKFYAFSRIIDLIGCCYDVQFNRYLQLKLLIKNCSTIFLRVKIFFPSSTQVTLNHIPYVSHALKVSISRGIFKKPTLSFL